MLSKDRESDEFLLVNSVSLLLSLLREFSDCSFEKVLSLSENLAALIDYDTIFYLYLGVRPL